MVGTLTVAAAGAAAAPAAQPKPGAAPAAQPKPGAAPAAAQPKPGAAAAAQPKPAASPAAEAPRALPRTGEADSWAIGGLAVVAVALLGAGLLARRRGI
jgi:LPXTG-motif cell wall-anchored protein